MTKEKKALYLQSNMCMIGGYFGAYALMIRLGNLGSAQTNNMIQIVCCLLGKDYIDFLLRIVGIILYISAITICTTMRKRNLCNVQKYSILVDVVGMFVLAVLPEDINPIIGLLPIFFMMSTQWSVFCGNEKYNSSTIFSTINLKQCTISTVEYLMDGDKEHTERALFFGNSIFWYHLGVALSFIACSFFSVQASVFSLPLAISAFALASVKTIET